MYVAYSYVRLLYGSRNSIVPAGLPADLQDRACFAAHFISGADPAARLPGPPVPPAAVCAANGNLFPCTRFITSKPDASYILGNVFDDPTAIWSGPVARDILDFFNRDKEDCEGCAIRFRCHAHECACTSFYSTGSIHGVSPEVCTHERMLAAICDSAICD